MTATGASVDGDEDRASGPRRPAPRRPRRRPRHRCRPSARNPARPTQHRRGRRRSRGARRPAWLRTRPPAGAGERRARRGRGARSHRPSGCSDPSSAEATSRSSSIRRPKRRATRTTSVTRGRPSVSVPVLSNTTVAHRAEPLERLGVAEQHTRPRHPCPVPTMIDVGVARPSAHGQAMISTGTVLSSARLNAGSGPSDQPDDERERGESEHDRDEDAGHDVREPLDRRPRALRLRDEADDPGEDRVATDARRAHGQGPGRVERSRRSPRRRRALATGMLSPVTMLSSTAERAVHDRRRPRRSSRRAARGRGRRPRPARSAPRAPSRHADDARRSRREADQAPDRVRGVRCRARASR